MKFREIVRLIESHMDVIDEKRSAINLICKNLRHEGVVTGPLRNVIREKRTPNKELKEIQKAIIRAALAKPGASIRSVANELGLSKSKVHRDGKAAS